MNLIKVLTQEEIDSAFENARNNTANEEERDIVFAWALANYGRYNMPLDNRVGQIINCECGNGDNCCKVV